MRRPKDLRIGGVTYAGLRPLERVGASDVWFVFFWHHFTRRPWHLRRMRAWLERAEQWLEEANA